MTQHARQGAIAALLDEYQRAIADLIKVLEKIPDDALTVIIDPKTKDANCRTIQSILTHVVHAGFGYAVSIRNSRGHKAARPGKTARLTIKEYIDDIEKMFAFTEDVFKSIKNSEIEQLNNSLKIKVSWGQSYDIEQLMEHAIVHILRHRRQIEWMMAEEFN